MISRYNQHSPHGAQLLPEQILLKAERSLNVGFVLLPGIGDLCNAKRLAELHSQSLYADFGQKLVDLRPRLLARVTKRLSEFVDLSDTRIGVYKCRDCRKPFRVTVGTIFEASHIPLNVWLQAVFLVASSKKGISSNQLHRSLGVTLKSAWFMSHRIREAMREGNLAPFGADGGVVEVDETFIGHDHTIKPKGEKRGRGWFHKNKILALVDRTTGQARSVVVDDLRASTLAPIVRANVAREAKLMTDEASYYTLLGREFAGHNIVNHQQGEYVSKLDNMIHTNTIEGFFGVFKRGMKGVYQHCAHNHLHRYLAEFDFRYNNRKALGVEDSERADKLLKGVVGKRLTYQTTAS